MIETLTKESSFYKGLEKLGFDKECDSLFLTNDPGDLTDPQIKFHLEKASLFKATGVFLRKQLNGSYKPQAYLYDYTGSIISENALTEIQRKIWSSGEAPLACIFYDTEIKILDCTRHVNDDETPVYLVKNLKISAKANKLYNQLFAIKIKSGVFWEEAQLKGQFKFQYSAYDILIDHIRKIRDDFLKNNKQVDALIFNKIIIQSILIKYLEERVDNDGSGLFSDKYFTKYGNAKSFADVLLKRGECVNLFDDLNKGFNGNIFCWENNEKDVLRELDLSILANALNADSTPDGQKSLWRYYEFNYIPVELISRLYEEFLGQNKQETGLYYTPSHLVKLLVDEAMPLKQFDKFDFNSYKILDPACGSGIFLVSSYKRLVQWWRLQNGLKKPEPSVLKQILVDNIFGVDKENQAVRLSAFSLCLALCDELSPKQIIEQLKFDDLTVNNIVHSDFFEYKSLNTHKFDLVIGNPPFNRGAIRNYSSKWKYDSEVVNIPQGQIALKFLSESLTHLKDNGLLCLIIKSSGLLYNSTSESYKKLLFSKLNVIQILDFTALARNKALWDNGADVAAAAVFIKKELPDFDTNVLHLTFRRTKATKERIVFEIDDYDLHFVNRQEAISNPFIWKNNLLGGGRIKTIISKLQPLQSFSEYLRFNESIIEEGFEIGSKEKLSPDYIYELPFLPTDSISENEIDYSKLETIDKKIKFSKIPSQDVFVAPNLIIWEGVGKEKFPIFYNNTSFSFKRRMIGIKSRNNDIELLNRILGLFESNYKFIKFYLLATSSETLINRNNTFLLKDIKNLPSSEDYKLSDIDNNIIEDIIRYMSDFFIHGESSIAIKRIGDDFTQILNHYGNEFCKVLNLIYEGKESKFRLSDIIQLYDKSFIAAVFKFDNEIAGTKFYKNTEKIDIPSLSDYEFSRNLSINRIIKIYPEKDTIIFVKPNQYRYWLSLAAYRDADKCFADLSKLNY